MDTTLQTRANDLLCQITQHPNFIKLNTIETFGLQMLYTIAGYVVFFSSTWAYLSGHIHYLVMMLLNGYSMLSMFTILHDATHGAVSRKPWLNEAAGTLGAFIYFPGMSTKLYRLLHLTHHRFTGDAQRDPDIKFASGGIVRCMLYALVKDLYWGVWIAQNHRDLTASDLRSFARTSIIFVAWYGGWLLSPYALEFVMIYLLPQRVGYVILVYFFAHAPHPAGIKQSEQPFTATEVVDMPLWAGLLLTNQDLHPVHHLFPSIPWHRYRKVWALGETLLAREIPRRYVVEKTYRPVEARVKMDALITVKIDKIDGVAVGVKRYQLISPTGAILPKFSPGAHIDVHINEQFVRQYSLCNDSKDSDRYVIAVKCDENGRGGSVALHREFRLNKQIEVSFPRNHFHLGPNAARYQLVAGGIGITPILSMAKYLHSHNKNFTLHVFSRSPDELPLADELTNSPYQQNICYYYSRDLSLQQRDISKIIGKPMVDNELYICGPTLFMQHFVEQATSDNWSSDNIHLEAFSASKVGTEHSNDIVNQPFELTLTQSNKTVTVGANESIVEAAKRAKVTIATSCEMGLCATCVCEVVAGDIDHRDCVLSAQEHANGKKLTACVSRAKGKALSLRL